MTDLLTALTDATEGSRELSDRMLLSWGWEPPKLDDISTDYYPFWVFNRQTWTNGLQPDPSRNLQDALDGVPEGWQWDVRHAEFPQTRPTAFCWPSGQRSGHANAANTPALALCIAIEKARQEDG